MSINQTVSIILYNFISKKINLTFLKAKPSKFDRKWNRDSSDDDDEDIPQNQGLFSVEQGKLSNSGMKQGNNSKAGTQKLLKIIPQSPLKEVDSSLDINPFNQEETEMRNKFGEDIASSEIESLYDLTPEEENALLLSDEEDAKNNVNESTKFNNIFASSIESLKSQEHNVVNFEQELKSNRKRSNEEILMAENSKKSFVDKQYRNEFDSFFQAFSPSVKINMNWKGFHEELQRFLAQHSKKQSTMNSSNLLDEHQHNNFQHQHVTPIAVGKKFKYKYKPIEAFKRNKKEELQPVWDKTGKTVPLNPTKNDEFTKNRGLKFQDLFYNMKSFQNIR